MKRLAMVPIVAVLAFAGCATVAPDRIAEEDYFSMVRGLASYEGMPDANLVELGDGFCSVRDVADESGADQLEVELQYLKMATEQGIAAGDVGSFMPYATARFCPEYLGEDGLASLLE